MIKEIIMKNIKGQVTNQPLSGRDIICGTNGTGKTTRAQAIGISLLGYAPTKGKLASETYKLCSNGVMTVGLKTEDFEFTRSFLKKTTIKNGLEDTTISQELSVFPTIREKTIKQKEARITDEVGNLPVMLDFNEFLNLSDPKRREFFYDLAEIDTDTWSKEGIQKKLIDGLLTSELEENNTEMFFVLDLAISEVMKQYSFDDIQISVQSMLDYSKGKLAYWKAEKQKAEGASQKISEYKNELQVTDRNLEKNKVELEKLQQALITVSNRIAVIQERKNAKLQRVARIAELATEIEGIFNEKPPDSETSIMKKIKGYESDIKHVDNGMKIEAVRKAILVLKAEMKQNEDVIRQYSKQISSAESNSAMYRSLVNMINQNKGHCAIDKRIKCNKNFEKFIDFANEQIEASNNIIMDNDISIGNAEMIIDQKIAEIVKSEQEINQLIDEERAVNKKNEGIRTIIGQLKNNLNIVKGFDSVKAEKINIRQSEMDRLSACQEDELKDIHVDISEKEEIEVKISKLKWLIDEQSKTRIRLLDFKSSVIDGKEAAYNEECWKLISKALGPSGIQGEIVKSILNPVKDAIQEKLDAMDVQKDFFFETSTDKGKEVFQFGWLSDTKEKYNFDALSTGEQMLLLIALITTIIEQNAPPLKILMIDNIENLDKENFKKVLAGMDNVAQGLDNVIFLGVIEPEPDDCPGWVIWNLNRDSEAVTV